MFTASVLTLLLAAGQGAHSLQWKLKEGDVFYNKTSVTMDQTIEVMGQKIDQAITVKTVLKFKVKSVKDGAAVVEMTYLENKVDARGLPGANIGDKLKDVTFTATLDRNLRVEKLEGYDKFLDALSEGDENQQKLLRAMMPEATIRQMFGQTFVVGPGKPVAVGGTWDRTTKIALGPLGIIETKERMKLASVKDDLATISVKADLTFQPGDGEAGLPFKITRADLKADKFTAAHLFDMKAGRLTETKVDLEMSGSMTISVAGQTVDAKLVQKMKTVGVITDKNPLTD
jgi:hypothetical protein